MKLTRTILIGCFLFAITLFMTFSGGCSNTESKAVDEILSSPVSIGTEILYQEDFSAAKNGWYSGSNDSMDCYFEQGEYSFMDLKTHTISYSGVPSGKFSDFILELDSRAVSAGDSGGWGVEFRRVDSANYYVFLIRNGSFRLQKMVQGQWQTLRSWKSATAIQSVPNSNQLKVACQGTQIDLYVNGQRLGSYTDSSFNNGIIGLAVEEAGTHVHFDNLRVYAVGSSQKTVIAAATSASLSSSQSISAPLAAPVSIGTKILYQDDFSDASSGWSSGSKEYGDFYYESGEYSLLKVTDGMMWTSAPGDKKNDFAVEIDSRALTNGKEGSWGIIFRMQDNNNYYMFTFKDGGFKWQKQVNGKWEILQDWKQSGSILSVPNTNHLKVACYGAQIDLYSNGQLLGSFTDSSLSSGSIGLVVTGINTHVHFDNLKVYEAGPNSSNKTTTTLASAIPDEAVKYYNQAVQYRKSGDATRAVEYYTKAIQTYGMYAEAWEAKAEVLVDLGEYDEALTAYQTVVEIDPDDSQAWVNEGRCQEELGDQDGAMSCYNRALEVDPGNTEAQTAKDSLVASGVADNTDTPPVKQYDSKHPLTANVSNVKININENYPFSNQLTVQNGQPPYTWSIVGGNVVATNLCISWNDTGDTATISGLAVNIAESSQSTSSRIGEINIKVEDSSDLIRQGTTSFYMEVTNLEDTPTPTETTQIDGGAAVALEVAREYCADAEAYKYMSDVTFSYSNPEKISYGNYKVLVTVKANQSGAWAKASIVLYIDTLTRTVVNAEDGGWSYGGF